MSELVLENKSSNGWIKTNLEMVSNITTGNSAPQSEEFFKNGKYSFVRVADMGKTNTVYLNDTKDHVNELGAKKLKMFPKGSVLFTKSGASTHLNQKSILGMDSYVVSHIGIINPLGKIPSKFIYYFLKTIDFKTLTHESVMPSLQLSKIKTLDIFIPPLNEQKRIVAKIEELFSLIDNYEIVLISSKSKLTKCINSVFQKGLTGELTTSWRLQNSSYAIGSELGNIKNSQEKDLKEINSDDLQILPKIPSTWSWVRLGKISLVKDVDHKMPKTTDDGIPFVSPKDFLDDGTIDFKNTKKISPTDFIMNTKKIKPRLGDILFSRYGTIGKAILVPNKKFGLSYSIAVIRPIFDKINFNWLHLILQSPFVLHQAISGEQSSTMADLGLITIRNFLIPLPSSSEQQIIATTLDKYISNFNNQLKQLDVNIKLSKNLRNSILKQAFEGKLVPQDPNDEPASELLEKIKQEKQKIISQSKRGKK